MLPLEELLPEWRLRMVGAEAASVRRGEEAVALDLGVAHRPFRRNRRHRNQAAVQVPAVREVHVPLMQRRAGAPMPARVAHAHVVANADAGAGAGLTATACCRRCARPRGEPLRSRRSTEHEAAPRRWRRGRSPPAATAGGRSGLVVVAAGGRAEPPHFCRGGEGNGEEWGGGMVTNRGRCPLLTPGINGRRRFTGGRGQRGLGWH